MPLSNYLPYYERTSYVPGLFSYSKALQEVTEELAAEIIKVIFVCYFYNINERDTA